MKRAILLAIGAVSMVVVSCNKSDLQSVPVTPDGETVELSISLTADPLDASGIGSKTALDQAGSDGFVVDYSYVDTKSTTELTEAVETQMNSLQMIQFTPNGAKTGYFSATAGDGNLTQDGNAVSLKATFTANGGSQNIYFVANSSKNLNEFANEGAFLAHLEKLTEELKPSAMVMYGKTTVTSIAAGTTLSGIQMKRLYAKIKLHYDVAPAFAASGFKVTDITLKNVAQQYGFIDQPANGSNKPAYSAGNSHFDYPGETTPAAKNDYTWYVPENYRSGSGVTALTDRILAKTDTHATYIEIKGTVGTKKLTYNILLGDPTGTGLNDFNVKRNTTYTVTVTIMGDNTADKRIEVVDGGAAVVGGAANCYMVSPGNSVWFNARVKGNAPSVSLTVTDVKVLWQDAPDLIESVSYTAPMATVKTRAVRGGGNALVAAYNGADIVWSWHIWVTDYKPLENTVTSRAVNQAYTVPGGKVHTYGSNFTTATTGTGFVTANNNSRVIMDRNLGATIAYYAPPQSDQLYDAYKSFGFFYQWGRKDPLPMWNGKGSSDTGAEAITLYSGSGNPGPAMTTKDVTTIPDAETNTQTYATANPLTFIYSAATPFDWYTTVLENQDKTLWGDGSTKSMYDPCPAGWRIGKNGTWGDFAGDPYTGTAFQYYIKGVKQTASGTPAWEQNALNGRYYAEAGAWYPAPGYRHRGTGGLTVVGRYGYSRASAVSGVHGCHLNFHQGGLNPSNVGTRASGLQVRCLRE